MERLGEWIRPAVPGLQAGTLAKELYIHMPYKHQPKAGAHVRVTIFQIMDAAVMNETHIC